MSHFTEYSALIFGLFFAALAIDELRRPGQWHKIVEELEGLPLAQLLTGLLELVIGALLYFGNRGATGWPGDWLAAFLTVIGGLAILEALAIIAFSDVYDRFWARKLGTKTRGIAAATLVISLALSALALIRLA